MRLTRDLAQDLFYSFITDKTLSCSVSAGWDFKPGPLCSFTKDRSPRLKSRQFRPPTKKTKSISMLTLKPSDLRPASKNQVNFDPAHKNKSFPIPTLKRSQIGPPTQKSSWFRRRHWNQVNSILTLKPSQFRCPDTKTKLISIHALNPCFATPTQKTSRSRHWNQVKFNTPYQNQVIFHHLHKPGEIRSHTRNLIYFPPTSEITSISISTLNYVNFGASTMYQVNFDINTKIKSFSKPTQN